MEVDRKEMWLKGSLCWTGSGCGPLVGFCECDSETNISWKWEIFCQFSKDSSV